jgi:hypothetical protein
MANVTSNPAMEYALGYTNAEHERLTRQAARAGMCLAATLIVFIALPSGHKPEMSKIVEGCFSNVSFSNSRH